MRKLHFVLGSLDEEVTFSDTSIRQENLSAISLYTYLLISGWYDKLPCGQIFIVLLAPDALSMCLFCLRVDPALYIHHHQYLTDHVGVIGNKRDLSVKSYLRSTIGDKRLSNLSLMHLRGHVQVDLNMLIGDFSLTYTSEQQWIIHHV